MYAMYVIGKVISIHALREESDRVRGDGTAMLVISIHALREESDLRSWTLEYTWIYFNPRSP